MFAWDGLTWHGTSGLKVSLTIYTILLQYEPDTKHILPCGTLVLTLQFLEFRKCGQQEVHLKTCEFGEQLQLSRAVAQAKIIKGGCVASLLVRIMNQGDTGVVLDNSTESIHTGLSSTKKSSCKFHASQARRQANGRCLKKTGISPVESQRVFLIFKGERFFTWK